MLDWFTTIPGILVICGVILLIIALILFILGNKNEKKVGKGENLVVDNNVESVQPLTSTEVSTVSEITEPVEVSTAPLGDDMITGIESSNGIIDFGSNNGVDINEVTSEFDFSLPTENNETNETVSYDFSLDNSVESNVSQEPEITITEPTNNDYSFGEIETTPFPEATVVDTNITNPTGELEIKTIPITEETPEVVIPTMANAAESTNNDMFATPAIEPIGMPTIEIPTIESAPIIEEKNESIIETIPVEPVREVPTEPIVEEVTELAEPVVAAPVPEAITEPIVEEKTMAVEPTVEHAPTIEPVSTVTFEMPTVEIPANDNNQF